MFAAIVLDSEIIDNGEILDKAIVSELADLGKTVHAFADFNEDVVIVDEVCELVLLNDTVGSDLTGIRMYWYCSVGVFR